MPAALEFLRPESLDEAVAQLVEYDGEARVLAGSTALTSFPKIRPTNKKGSDI